MLPFLIALGIFLVAVIAVILKDRQEKSEKKSHNKEQVESSNKF